MPRGLTHLENLELTYVTGTMLDDAEPKAGGLVKTFIAKIALNIGDAVVLDTVDNQVTKAAAGVKVGIVVGGQAFAQVNEVFPNSGDVGRVAASAAGQWVKVLIHGIAYAVSDAAAAIVVPDKLTIVGAAAVGQVLAGAAVAGEASFTALSPCLIAVNGVIKVLVN